MSKLFETFKAWIATLAALPIVAPILEVLYSRSVTFAILGVFVYGLLPTSPWLSSDPVRLKTIGDIVIVLTLLITGRYSIEGLVDAYKQVPTGTLDDLVRNLLSMILERLLNPNTPEEEEAAKAIARNQVVKESTVRFMAGRPGTDG